jgi:hypothetical protein
MDEYTVLSPDEATAVERPAAAPWTWPGPAQAMVGNTYELLPVASLKAPNGDPLQLALAVNMLESLYAAGYVVARRRGAEA